MAWKLKEGEPVYNHVQRIQRYVERLERLNVNFDKELSVDMDLNSLPHCYDQLILAYNLKSIETTLAQFHNILRATKSGMKKNQTYTSTNALVLALGKTKVRKGKLVPSRNGRESPMLGRLEMTQK